MMDKYIDRFPEQLLEAVAAGKIFPELKFDHPIKNIVVSGMGGSGIGGAMAKQFTGDLIDIPFETVNDYTLPAYINENTLLICSSYSGNTEETLSAFQHGVAKKCNIVCISTGGKLRTLADSMNIFTATMPGGNPPRTCLGYSFVSLLFILFKTGCISNAFIPELEKAAAKLSGSKTLIQSKTKAIAEKISGTIPLIYSSPKLSAIGTRIKQQLNENSKMHAFANVIPEMNHNELVAFYSADQNISVIYLRDMAEPEQIRKRFIFSKELIQPKVRFVEEIFADGNSYIEKIFYLVHIGDWISFYLSEIKQVDPIKIDALDWLKQELEQK
ncbi:MAG: bifunctional phosphoglucose/phosphomannose isomerase [Chitinophagales bacterium]